MSRHWEPLRVRQDRTADGTRRPGAEAEPILGLRAVAAGEAVGERVPALDRTFTPKVRLRRISGKAWAAWFTATTSCGELKVSDVTAVTVGPPRAPPARRS